MTGASTDATPIKFNTALDSGPAGDAASRQALSALASQISSLRATKAALPYMKRAVAYCQSKDFEKAREAAQRAVDADPSLVIGWHILGIALEKTDDFPGALDAYERGLALDPTNPPIANDLGRLAMRLEMLPQAEALFRHYLAHRPNSPEAANNLGCLLRAQMRFQEAIDVLKPAVQAYPDRGLLWITLGTVVGDMGQIESAEAFYREAIRLEPKNAKARYNLSHVLYTHGDLDEAISLGESALADADCPSDAAMMRFALAVGRLTRGDLAQGWENYDARLDPHYHEPIHFVCNRPRWTPGADIAGRHLFLFGEQGLGDEIMFASLLPDVLRELGPGGRLTMAVTDRLLPLFQRSFPGVNFGFHKTVKHRGHNIRSAPFIEAWEDIDLWAPMAEPVRQFRLNLENFPDRPEGFMRADPERVAYWRGVLEALPGPKVGLLWTSLVVNNHRQRFFAAMEEWEPLLRTPGVTFVNLQYGDRSADLALARERFGVEIFHPPGIDLRNDLDDVAALASALDLVVGISNASFNIAAACGAPCWLVTGQRSWTRLGTDRYPWYSQVRVFENADYNDWSPVMTRLGEALSEHVNHGTQLRAAG
jgi:tetratricopeptide (TPR) repeat protein